MNIFEGERVALARMVGTEFGDLDQLQHFEDIYEHGEIPEILERR